MAKTQTYTEDQLMDAVVRYAEIYKGKIVVTRLAQWASQNIHGLEGVKNHHFTKDIIVTNPKTGKKQKKRRRCAEKIEELNAERSVSSKIKTNTLLQSANIDAFMDLPEDIKRQLIVETRKQVDELVAANRRLSRENAALSSENKEYKDKTDTLESMLKGIQQRQDTIEKTYVRTINFVDKNNQKETLGRLGVQDDGFDLNQYIRSLHEDMEDAFKFSQAIKGNAAGNSISEEELFEGIEF